MILPTKHLREDQALIAVGAELLGLLDEPKTVSRLWDELRRAKAQTATAQAAPGPKPAQQSAHARSTVPFDWFILALDLLYLLGAVELQRGRIRRVSA